MVRSLNSGVSGVQQFQEKLDVIGNNIANSNTHGYKSARADFEDAFSQTMQAPGNVAGIQVGSGVNTGAIRSQFNQGTISRTGVETDLAIEGEGFFMVRDSFSGEQFATRAGDFRVDKDGFLVNNGGLRVQGYSDAGLTARGDLRIDPTGAPAGAAPGAIVAGFSVNDLGIITVRLSDGSPAFTRGQVLLQRFQDPNALIKEGNNLFSGFANAGALGGATPQSEAPKTNGLGIIRSSALEMSNVDLAGEFTSLIITQRGFQASARIITTSDEMLQEVVNLKR